MVAKGNDQLEVIENGYYELNDNLFDSNNQFASKKQGPDTDYENAKLIYSELSF